MSFFFIALLLISVGGRSVVDVALIVAVAFLEALNAKPSTLEFASNVDCCCWLLCRGTIVNSNPAC